MDSVVRTSTGAVRGLVRDGMSVFRGIPFAAAPEGPLRFHLPAPPPAWDGIRDATTFGPAPPQLPPAPGVPPAWKPGDGLDCLTVNVWTPETGSAALPVLVWIYGGAWKGGAASQPGDFCGPVEAARVTGIVADAAGVPATLDGFAGLAPEAILRVQDEPAARITRIWDVPPADVGYPLADSYRMWAAHRG
jgi:para-nitrobenzyl esterase